MKNKLIRPELCTFVFLIISILAGRILSPNFLDVSFLMSSTSLYAELGLIAIAFTFVMTTGEIDLSVASNMTLVACTVAVLYQMGIPMILLLPGGLMIGTVLGLLNGFLVIQSGLPSLIITIGTMSVYKGLSQVLVGDAAISGFPKWFLGIDKAMLFSIVPVPLVIVIVMAIMMELVLQGTFTGRKIVAIGLNQEASRYSAVHVGKMKMMLFGMQGCFCGAAGLISISRLEVAKYSIGTGGEIDVITMVLLGGTAFSGGRGNVLGTLLAFFILVFIRTGMRLAILSDYAQTAVLGALLILIIIISQRLELFSKEHT